MSEDRAELRSLAAAFRAHLEARSRSGLLGVPGAPSPRVGPAEAPRAAKSATKSAPGAQTPPSADPAAPSAETPPRERPAPAAGPPAGAEPASPQTLEAVRAELGDCRRCRLCEGRQNLVFGVGNPDAKLVFVGEAPGADEDRQGEPFVGAAGQLLTKMIEAMGFSREDVYICNVIKCRPPGNRDPQPDEVATCEPFLRKQLAAIRPRMIVALGRFASQSLCGELTPISRLRGSFRTYAGIQVMPTFHPSYVLRNESNREVKALVWRDLKEVVAALRRMGIEPPRQSRA